MRVAAETENANLSGRWARRCRVIEVLPDPEGAAMIISLFRLGMCKEREKSEINRRPIQMEKEKQKEKEWYE